MMEIRKLLEQENPERVPDYDCYRFKLHDGKFLFFDFWDIHRVLYIEVGDCVSGTDASARQFYIEDMLRNVDNFPENVVKLFLYNIDLFGKINDH